MPRTLKTIQEGCQIAARDSNLTLISGDGLIVSNRLYRWLCLMFPWGELRRQDTSLSTTAGTEAYTWPSSPVFLDIKSIEIQDQDKENEYRLVYPCTNEWIWNESSRKSRQSIPDHYLRISTSDTVNQIAFRPLPKYTSATIRITGIIEPTLWNSNNASVQKSIFLNEIVDDALEYLIASEWIVRDGDTSGYGQFLLDKALRILTEVFGKEQVPVELFRPASAPISNP